MNEEIEIIDSSEMEVLSEFPFGGDGSVLEKLRNVVVAYRMGILDDKFVIASQSGSINDPKLNVVPREATERYKLVVENSIKRDWWSADVFFDLVNFDAVLERIEQVYGLRTPSNIDLNDFEIKNGKDKLAVRRNSIMPSNVGKPIETFQIANGRVAEMDLSHPKDGQFWTDIETGKKIMTEMRRIQPLVKARLQTIK